MRILNVSDLYPPIIGGVERHVQMLSHELVRRGHEVAVATLHQKGFPTFELDAGVRVHRITGWNRLLSPFYQSATPHFHPPAPDPGVIRQLRALIEEEQPDIIHANGWIAYSCLALRRRSQIPLAITLHDHSLICPKMSYFTGTGICTGPQPMKCIRCASADYGMPKAMLVTGGVFANYHLHHLADLYIANSRQVRDAVLQNTKAALHIEVVSSFIPDDAVEAGQHVERPAFLPARDDYILFVGQLSNHKGLRVLLKAYRGLEHLAPLVVIGTEQPTTPKQFPDGVVVVQRPP